MLKVQKNLMLKAANFFDRDKLRYRGPRSGNSVSDFRYICLALLSTE